MDTRLNWGAIIGGAILINVVLAIVGIWARKIVGAFKPRVGRKQRREPMSHSERVVLVAVPLVMVLIVLWCLRVSSKPWASSLFLGAAVWGGVYLLFMAAYSLWGKNRHDASCRGPGNFRT